jgi:O-antigen/teichoic acid export membrane protein
MTESPPTHDHALPSASPLGGRQSLWRNLMANLIGHGATNGANFLINVLLVHHVGKQMHGQYAMVWSISALAVFICTAGLLGSLGIRQVAAAARQGSEQTNRHINGFAGTSILLSLALGLAMVVFADPIARWQGEDIADLIRLASIWPLSRVLLRVPMMVATGLEASSSNAINMAMFHTARLVWLIAAAVMGFSLLAIFIGWAIVMPVAGLATFLTIRPMLKRLNLRIRPCFVGPGKFIAMLRQSFPFLLANASTMLTPATLQLILGSRLPDAESVSFFQVAFSISVMMILLAQPTAQTVLPTITRMHHSDEPGSDQVKKRLARRAYTALATLSLAVASLTAWAGPWLLGEVFEAAYGAQGLLLVLLTIAAAVKAQLLLLDRVLFVADRQRTVAVVESLRYAALLTVSWLAVPHYGAVAAAWTLLLCDTASLAIRLPVVKAAMDVRLARVTLCWAVTIGLIAVAFAWAGSWPALGMGIVGTIAFHLLARTKR